MHIDNGDFTKGASPLTKLWGKWERWRWCEGGCGLCQGAEESLQALWGREKEETEETISLWIDPVSSVSVPCQARSNKYQVPSGYSCAWTMMCADGSGKIVEGPVESRGDCGKMRLSTRALCKAVKVWVRVADFSKFCCSQSEKNDLQLASFSFSKFMLPMSELNEAYFLRSFLRSLLWGLVWWLLTPCERPLATLGLFLTRVGPDFSVSFTNHQQNPQKAIQSNVWNE